MTCILAFRWLPSITEMRSAFPASQMSGFGPTVRRFPSAERGGVRGTEKEQVSGTLVGIRIDKWGLKDAQTYIEPMTSDLAWQPF